MVSQVPNQQNPMFAFDQSITQIYFRNDTEVDYQIILVPKSTKFKDFPQRSIVIVVLWILKKPGPFLTYKLLGGQMPPQSPLVPPHEITFCPPGKVPFP
jgi:hypothetical protein